jgi:membrane protein YqaA with SNARE-associated domain
MIIIRVNECVCPRVLHYECPLPDFEALDVKQAVDIADDPLVRKLLWQSVAAMVVLFAIVATLAIFFKDPITSIAHQLVDNLGIVGIFLGVLAADGLMFPIPPTTYLFIAVAAGIPIIPVLIAAAVAGLLGGAMAYGLGPTLQKVPFLNRRIEAFRPRGEQLFKRWGSWTIAIAAVTPLPFSLICWFAGIYRMPFKRFISVSAVRAPRLLVYYGIFTLGWAA